MSEGIKVRLSFDPSKLREDEREIQKWVTKNLKIKIPIELDKNLAKSVTDASKKAQDEAKKVKKAWTDVLTDLSKLKNVDTTIVNGEAVRKVAFIKNELGEVLKITQKLGKDGNWLESTKVVSKFNQDAVNNLKNNLNLTKKEFDNKFLKLDKDLSGFYDDTAISKLKNNLQNLKVNENLPLQIKQLKLDFEEIVLKAQALKKITPTVTNKSSNQQASTKQPLNPINDTKGFDNNLNKIISNLNKIGAVTKVVKDEFGKVNISVDDGSNKVRDYSFQWDNVSRKIQKLNEISKETQTSNSTGKALEQQQKIDISLQKQLEGQISNNLKTVKSYYTTQQNEIAQTILLRKKEIEQIKKQAIESKNLEHWLKLQKQDFESKSIKFEKNRTGLYDPAELEKVRKSMQGLSADTPNVRKRVQELNSAFKQLDAKAVAEGLNMANKHAMSLGESLALAGKKMVIWTVVGDALFSVINLLQQIPTVIVEIDSRLTEMAKVMSSSTDFSVLMDNLVQSSNNFGRSIIESQEAVIEFGRQGFEASQAIDLANTAMLGANVTGMQTVEVAGYLTATMAQFNLTAEDTVRIIDKVNEVDNNYAVTSQGLMQSIAKAGETAQQYGLTLDELIGYTTAVTTATKESGSVIGNFFKFSLARLNDDKAEKALKGIGIAIKDISGELRPASQIYQEVAAKWDVLTRSQRAFIAESLAGKHHITRFMALMDNFDLAGKATNTSQTSMFSSLEENRKHLESLESQINQVKASGQELSFSLGKAGLQSAMSGVLGLTKDFVTGLTEMVEASTGTKIAVGALGVSMVGLVGYFTSFIPLVRSAGVVVKEFTLALASNPYGLVAVAITTVVAGLIAYIGHQRQLNQEQLQFNAEVDKSIQKWNELSSAMNQMGRPTVQNINDTEAMIGKFKELQSELNKLMNSLPKKPIPVDIQVKTGQMPKIPKLTIEDTPDKIKDLAKELGINVTQFNNLQEVIGLVNNRINQLNGELETGKNNSIEYQQTQLRNSQLRLEEAKNSALLVEEYKKLEAQTVRNQVEEKRYGDLKNVLMSLFPIEWQQSNERISAMESEANARIKRAEVEEQGYSRQFNANLASTQNAYDTANKNIAIYEAEIKALSALWAARANQNAQLMSQGKEPIKLGQGDKQAFDYQPVLQKQLTETKAYANEMKKVLDQANQFKLPRASLAGGGGKAKLGGSGGGGSSPKTGKSTEQIQLEKFTSLITKAKNEYNELTKLLDRKTNLGIVTGIDVFKEKLQNQQKLVDSLFNIESDLNQKLKDYQAQLGKYKAGTQQYKALQGIISLVKKDISSLPAEQEKQVTVLAKLKQQMTEIEYLTSKRTLQLKIQLGILKGFEAEDANIDVLKTKLDGLFEQANTLNEQFTHNQEQIAANNKIARDALNNRNKFKKGTADWLKWDKINKDAVADNKKLVSLNSTLGTQQKSINATIQDTNTELEKETKLHEKIKETTDGIESNLQSVIDRIKEINNNSKDTLIDVGVSLNLNNKYGTDLFGTSEDFFDNIKSTVMEKVKGIERLKVDLANATSEGSRQLYEILHNPTASQADKDAIIKLIDEKDEGIIEALNKAGLTKEDLIKYTDSSFQAIVDLINKQKKEIKDAEALVSTYELELKALEDKVDAQEQLNQLKEKELKITELQAEIEKVKADKRFEFITEEGVRTLTYDIEKVNDLEKQKIEAQNDLKDFKYQQDVDNQKKAIQDKIDAQQKYIDEELPKIHAQEMAQYTQTWLAKELGTKQNEDTLTSFVKTGVLERINLYDQEIAKLQELIALQQGKQMPNLFEVQELERSALADPNLKSFIDGIKQYNTPVTKSTVNNSTVVNIGNMKFEGKNADAMYNVLKDMGITVDANA